MHLKDEFKEIGKENFHAAVASKAMKESRALIEKTVKQDLKSGAGLGAEYFGYGTVEKPIRVAVLGTGDEGNVLIGAINPKYIEVVAIADIRPYNVWRAFNGDHYSPTANKVRCGLVKKYGYKDEAEAKSKIKVYGDYMDAIKSFEKDGLDVEAVIIGLPLHLHAPAAIASMRAGYHVLTEKLMGQTVAACKEMSRVAKEEKKHLVTGHQRHYNVLYDHAVKMMQSGLLGDVHFIRAQWHRGNKPGSDSWQQPLPKVSKPEDDQAGKLEETLAAWKKARQPVYEKAVAMYERAQKERDPRRRDVYAKEYTKLAEDVKKRDTLIAQKQAQVDDAKIDPTKYGYSAKQIKNDAGEVVYDRPAMEELIRWRLWERTGGGLMAELGSHQLDASSIFLAAVYGGKEKKKQHPRSVEASAARSIFEQDREVDDHIFCLFEYEIPGQFDENDPVKKHNKVSVQYASINGNGFDDYGETVYGTKGTLVLERETRPFLFKLADTLGKTRVATNSQKQPEIVSDDKGDPNAAALGLLGTTGMDISRGYCEQEEHWAYCIRQNPEADPTKEMPRCKPEVALGDAVIALTTNLSAANDCRIEFDEEWFDIDSDKTPELLFVDDNDEEGKKRFTPNVDKYPS